MEGELGGTRVISVRGSLREAYTHKEKLGNKGSLRARRSLARGSRDRGGTWQQAFGLFYWQMGCLRCEKLVRRRR
ncbi:unnamed protein product [Dovyalis caffra]|uniref:Uncharacterized protein n=1 Tax=Dovyalis caffra TaxID=77055 RepID=A0AAV1R2W0_9ROSI|nr:unnamed protein product [Dovyalis caffra]